MLFSRSFLALAATAALTLGSTACVVRWTDEPIGDDDSSFFDDDSSSVSTGVGGDDSTTGVGGDDSAGVGGEDATSGTGGGDPYCIDGEGSGATTAMCDALVISPESFGLCDDGLTTLGYAACARSFEIWEGGYAEALAECLSYIPEDQACEEQPVIDCVEELYVDTCEVPYIEASCQSWADTCADGTFDAAQCYADITPFNDDGILQLTDCMNATEGTCQQAYEYCFEEVTALD